MRFDGLSAETPSGRHHGLTPPDGADRGAPCNSTALDFAHALSGQHRLITLEDGPGGPEDLITLVRDPECDIAVIDPAQ